MSLCLFCGSEYGNSKELCEKCCISSQPRILVDWEIKRLLELKVIRILPILNLKEQINPIGIDLTLDTKFKKLIKSNNLFVDPIEEYVTKDYYEDVAEGSTKEADKTLSEGEAKMHLGEAMKALQAGDIGGAMMHTQAAQDVYNTIIQKENSNKTRI